MILIVLKRIGPIVASTVLLASSVHAVPVAAVRHSGDPWESNDQKDPTSAPPGFCKPIDEAYYAQLPAPAVETVLPLLARVPIVRLSDSDAAHIVQLDGRNAQQRSFAGQFLSVRIAALELQRDETLVHHRGNWSLADQHTLNELTETIHGAQLASLHPYLIRSFAQINQAHNYYMVSMCGTTVVSLNFGSAPTSRQVRHAALVVLLPTAPGDAFVEWLTPVTDGPDW